MGYSNSQILELVKKAISSLDLASSGLLNTVQADKFIDYIVDETKLSKIARVIRFRGTDLDIDKIAVGARVAMPATEGVDPGVRRGVTTSKVTLTPREIIVPFELTTTFNEVNLEGVGAQTRIMKMFAKQLANDVERLNIHGDDQGPLTVHSNLIEGASDTDVVVDTLHALYDGYLELATGANVVDFSGNTLSYGTFAKMERAMPEKYKVNKSDLRFLVPSDIDSLYRERTASRATALGDAAANGQVNLTPAGIEMVPIPLMQFQPRKTTIDSFTGANTSITLDFQPILSGSVIVTTEASADSNPTTPFVIVTDYTVNDTTGVVTQKSTGNIGTTAEVRITYQAMPQIILTTLQNLILAFGREITMETDRQIFRRVNQFAITMKTDVKIENLDSVVLGKNISNTL